MADRPLTPSQVADLFNVSVATVAMWADKGLLPHFRTPGGQRRFHRTEVEPLVGRTLEPADPAA